MVDVETGAGANINAFKSRARRLVISYEFAAFSVVSITALIFSLFLAPPMPFTIDGGIYYEMTRSFTDHDALNITSGMEIDGAPASVRGLTKVYDGKVYGQYPAGYALVAAPFYSLLGIRGLMVMNSLAALISIALTFFLSNRLYRDRRIALWSALILGAATYLANYMFAIWPHALALAILLGATAAAVIGCEKDSWRTRACWFLTSGLFIGLGINIRLDIVLALPVLLIWITQMAKPGDRIAPLSLLAGAIPGFALAAWLNWIKFGIASPFHYGGDGTDHGSQLYFPLAFLGAALLAALIAFDFRKIVITAVKRRRISFSVVIIIAAAGVLGAGWGLFSATLQGMWVLIFNLQALQPQNFQRGVEFNEYGQLLFWDFPKRAFTQSLPFAALLIIPVVEFFRGEKIKAHGLCLLAIAAPVTFYAMTEWHGGSAYNLRYFMPALPFVAILSAVALSRLSGAGGVRLRALLIAAILAFGAFLAADELARLDPSFVVPAALYPQSAIFGILLFSTLVFVFSQRLRNQARRATLAIALFAIAYGAAVNFRDEVSHEKARASQFAQARLIAGKLQPNSLFLSDREILGIEAARNGATIMNVFTGSPEISAAAISAYAEAGRCVYMQGPSVSEYVSRGLAPGAIAEAPVVVAAKRFPDDPWMKIYLLSAQQSACAPQR